MLARLLSLLIVMFTIPAWPAFGKPQADSNLPIGNSSIENVTADTATESLPKLIVEQMAPALIFHPEEQYFPSNAEKFWQASLLCRMGNSYKPSSSSWVPGKHLEFMGAESLPLILPFQSKDNDFVTAGSPQSSSFDQLAPCYCEVWIEGDFVQAKYWYWIQFNDHPNDGAQNPVTHEGDWENIEMRARILNKQTFNFTYFVNRHDIPHVLVPTHWTKHDTTIFAHPKFWVAKGGHAPYEQPSNAEVFSIKGDSLLSALFTLTDKVGDSDNVWKTWLNLSFRNEHSDSPVWSFEGRWGDPELSPMIPVIHRRLTTAPRGPNTRKRFVNSKGASNFPE